MNNPVIQKAFELYMKNEYWREYYETAPTEICKEYIKLDFADSYSDDVEINKARLAMFDKLSLADWEHLKKYAGNNQFRAYCNKRIKALSA